MNRIEGTITEEMKNKYGGRGGSCDHFYECNSAGLSFICDLEKGYHHPDCPAGTDTAKRLDDKIANDPEMKQLIAEHRKLVAECSNKQKEE